MVDTPPDAMEAPWRRDPSELIPLLGAWARHAIGRDADVLNVAPPDGNGMSSETMLFDVRRAGSDVAEHYAARLAPAPDVYPVFPSYDLDLQRRCMELVRARTTVPAPAVPWCELDPSWLGVPFVVMNRVDGVVPPDIPPYVFGGWVVDLSPEDRARLQANAVSVLARLHEITPGRCDLLFLERPERGATPLDQQLGYQCWYYEWAREAVSYPLIERAFDWLEAHRPAEGPPVLNWGDARIGNILWDGVEPVAVLDWEMATVGPVEVDLAWMIFLHRFFQDIAERYRMPGLPDFMGRADAVATYEGFSGHPVRDLEWYEVFAALRFAIVSVRTSTRGIAYGTMEAPPEPDDLIMFRSLLEQMLDGAYWS